MPSMPSLASPVSVVDLTSRLCAVAVCTFNSAAPSVRAAHVGTTATLREVVKVGGGQAIQQFVLLLFNLNNPRS